MTDDNATRIADRRQQWQQLPAAQRLARVHGAVLRTVEIARWRRMARQRRNIDFLFPHKERRRG